MLLLVPLTAVVAAPRVYEASAVGSARNSYTDNKFDNTGSAAASLQQPWSTFSGNTIRAANILDAGAAISVAAGTSHVSVEHNKCAAPFSSVCGRVGQQHRSSFSLCLLAMLPNEHL